MALHAGASALGPNAVTYSNFQQVAGSSVVGNPTGSTANAQAISVGGGLFFSGTSLYAPAVHPGYISGNWYPTLSGVTVSAGVAIGSGSIRMFPFPISRTITVASLAARVTTLSAAGNFQLALYANNAATSRPTGAALVSTGNISTGATGAISANVTAQATLLPGTYWMAINQDNSTAVYQTIAATDTTTGYLMGSATLANVTSGSTGAIISVFTAQAFGTWPDLTSGSFTEATNQNNALVYMKAA